MKIEHIAIWTNRLEELKDFYVKYFEAKSNEMYHNPTKGFRSYFLTFGSGARLELMSKSGVMEPEAGNRWTGLAHFAVSVGSQAQVDRLTHYFRQENINIVGEPRWTGDGYYESVIADPDGNYIEITI